MNKKKQKKEKNPPLWIVILMILSVFIGISTAAIGINKIENYYHPYWFVLTFGGLGLVVGIFVAKRSKPHIAVNHRIKNNYGMAIMYISAGFIGIFVLAGTFINQNLSHIDKCGEYVVVNKYRQESHFRTPEINSLIVNIDGDKHRLNCSRNYWFNNRIGQKIKLNIYKSSMGFDYIILEGDK